MSKIEPIEAVEQPQNIKSLEDIAAYKDKLRKQIEHEEECIAGKWNELFHKEEPAPQGKAQKLLRMVSLGTGMFDGMMLGWKLYRKYQEGAFLFGGKKKSIDKLYASLFLNTLLAFSVVKTKYLTTQIQRLTLHS